MSRDFHLEPPGTVQYISIPVGFDGIATPIYPWLAGDWAQRPDDEKATDHLILPEEADVGAPVEGIL